MEDFLGFIARIFEVDKGILDLKTSRDDIDVWDSLMQVRLVAEIEENYHVEIPFDKISEINILGDFYSFINID